MKIRNFASTYPQLINQALREGMAHEDLIQLRDAYDTAEQLFDGLYRSYRVPFIYHLVRMASIMIAERQPVAAVNASLLHAAYMAGKFRDGIYGRKTESHRKELAQRAGRDVEELVTFYDQTQVHPQGPLEEHLRDLNKYDALTKQVLVMRVANELEDCLDNALAYSQKPPFYAYIGQYGTQMVELARSLGLSVLAGELALVFASDLLWQPPPEMIREDKNLYYKYPINWKNIEKDVQLKIRTWISGLIGR